MFDSFAKNLLAISLGLLLTTAASAISYSNQQRSHEATATVGESTTDSKSTTNLGFWSEITNANRFVGELGTATAHATQNSNLDDPGITMAGTLIAAATSSFPETPSASASARSSLSADFVLAANTPYIWNVAVTDNALLGYNLSDEHTAFVPLNSTGTLTPGKYHLTVNAAVGALSGEANHGDYSFTLAFIPEPPASMLIASVAASACFLRKPRAIRGPHSRPISRRSRLNVTLARS